MLRERDGADGQKDQPGIGIGSSWREIVRREIVRQITIETDPVRLGELCKNLDAIMLAEERKKVA